MKAMWREPLFHFLCLGLALFLGHALWQQSVSRADYTIHVSTAELERQALIFAGETRRKPSQSDLNALLLAHIEEQALMREAERLGLGEDDTIIRRRLAQKMRFLIEDVNPPELPDDATLAAWYEARKPDFTPPETRSFSHIYFSPDARGAGVEADAQNLMQQLNDALQSQAAPSQNWRAFGDPFIAKRQFQDVSQVDLQRVFGEAFAGRLFALEPGSQVGSEQLSQQASQRSSPYWQGPVRSSFGLHLVRVEAVNPVVVPDFDAVRDDVERAWQDMARRTENQARLKALVEKYDVVVEGADTPDLDP